MFDRLRDMWERLGPRERRLGALLGVVVVVCGVLYVAFMIQDGLHDLERHNDDTRAILATLNNRREELIEARSKQGETTAMIAEEHTALPTYLEKIAGEVGVQIRAQTAKPTVARGKFHEHALQVTLFDLSLEQLAKLLRGIETQSPVVVTQRVQIKRSALQKEKLDKVDLTIVTYSRAAAAKKPAAAAPAEGGSP
jgi:type II secretory pathway component PulM